MEYLIHLDLHSVISIFFININIMGKTYKDSSKYERENDKKIEKIKKQRKNKKLWEQKF